MKIFTNKYFTYSNFKVINDYLRKSPEIIKVQHNIYIPILIKDIKPINNLYHIDTQHSIGLPLFANKFEPKYFYKNEKYYDIIQKEDMKKYLINFDNIYMPIILTNYIKKGDIILIEDNDKVGVI